MRFFFRIVFWFSIRHLLKNPGRALMVLVGIALGAAVFTSVRLSVDASLSSFSASMSLLSGNADKVMTQPGSRVPESLIARVLKLPFVKTASPVMTTYAQPSGKDREPFLLIGLDPILDRPFRNWQGDSRRENTWLSLIKTPYSLMAAAPLLTQLNLKPGQSLELSHAAGNRKFSILAALTSEGIALIEGGKVAITDIATFQEFTGIFGEVDRIDIKFRYPPSPEQLQTLRRLPPGGVLLQNPGDDFHAGESMISAYELNLSVLSFVSLFVGMFLVYSLVAMNAASRRKELAILGALGCSRSLIFKMFIFEGFALGGAGWLLAIPISTLLLPQILNFVSKTISTLFVRVQVTNASLDFSEMSISFLVTVFISMLAAWHPAREAMKVPPREAMATVSKRESFDRTARNLALAAAGLILAVWPISTLPKIFGLPLAGYLATFVLFLGFSLFCPLALAMAAKWISPFLGKIGGQSAYLAGRYVKENGPRTAISVGALVTAVALFAAMVLMVNSFRQTVRLWVEHTVQGDLFVRPKMAGLNQYKDPMRPETVSYFKKLNQPVQLDPYRRIYLNRGNHLYQFEALNWDVYLHYGKFFWVSGNAEDSLDDLDDGKAVVVSEVFANQTGLGVGDRYQEKIHGARFDLPICGVIRDYRTKGGVVYYSLPHYQEKTGDSRWGGLRIFFHEDVKNAAEKISRLRSEILARHGDTLEATEGKVLRAAILKIFDETFAITTVLLVVALTVAALGITSTLTVLVLERRREFHTLFAVGADFKQIRAVIFWEAVIMVAVGEAAGMTCGFILSWLLIFVVNKQSFGWTFFYQVDILTLALSCPLIVLAALAAALPAIRLVFSHPPATILRGH